jgi:hypothetical protein
MACKPIILIAVLLLLNVGVNYAQLKIPMFDVDLKLNQSLVPGNGSKDGEIEFVETTNFYGGVHVQVNQYLAVGGFYSRSFRGEGAFRNNESNIKYDILQLQKGLDIRVSTSRAKKWRKYLVVNYCQIEMVQVSESFRSSSKTNAFGFNLGIMRKLSNNLYLNVIELGGKLMSDTMFWFGTQDNGLIIFDAKIGLTYNIGKRK